MPNILAIISSTNISLKSESSSLFLSSTSPLTQSTNLMLSAYLDIGLVFRKRYK